MSEDLERYGNLEVGHPYDAGKGDAIRGANQNPYGVNTTAHKAYEAGYSEQRRRDKMRDQVRRNSQR